MSVSVKCFGKNCVFPHFFADFPIFRRLVQILDNLENTHRRDAIQNTKKSGLFYARSDELDGFNGWMRDVVIL